MEEKKEFVLFVMRNFRSNVKDNFMQIVITGIGMVTSLGFKAGAICAAARAGIDRATELNSFELWDEELEEPVPAIGHPVRDMAEGFEGLGKLVRLGSLALKDLVNSVGPNELDWSRSALLVNLDSGYYYEQARLLEQNSLDAKNKEAINEEILDRQRQYSIELIPLILKAAGVTGALYHHAVSFKDQPGIIDLVGTSISLLGNKEVQRCIIGGIGSYVEPEVLEVLYELNLLKGSNNSGGFLPGEAAAFLVLERYETARLRPESIQGIIGSFAVSSEETHRFSENPPTGTALSEAIIKALGADSDQIKNCEMIGTLNGDPWKAQEWGNALVKLSSRHQLENIYEVYPAILFGETGAAAGAIAICLAARAYVRGYARKKNILVWLSCDRGIKGACTILKPATLGDGLHGYS